MHHQDRSHTLNTTDNHNLCTMDSPISKGQLGIILIKEAWAQRKDAVLRYWVRWLCAAASISCSKNQHHSTSPAQIVRYREGVQVPGRVSNSLISGSLTALRLYSTSIEYTITQTVHTEKKYHDTTS